MTPFSFQTTRSILSEVGATGKIGAILHEIGCRKVALVTDADVLGLGLAEAALEGLAEAGIEVFTYADVIADPPEARVLEAVAVCREAGVDGVVSVGGGSPMDTAKLIAVRLGRDQPIGDIYGIGNINGERRAAAAGPRPDHGGRRLGGHADRHRHHRERRKRRAWSAASCCPIARCSTPA